MPHILQLDALRATAALWVVLSHLLLVPGWSVPVLSRGENAVTVFVILSGFVIARLKLADPEPYGAYLLRRGARILPAYLLALVLGYLTMPLYAALGGLPFDPAPEANLLARMDAYQAAPLAHWLLHLTLLHGVVPDTVLLHSDIVFQGPLWSLSLEWQFYLVAPLLIGLLPRGGNRLLAALGILFAAAVALRLLVEPHWVSSTPAFLPLRLDAFVIGIALAATWERLQRQPAWLLAAGAGALVVVLGALGIARTALVVAAGGFLLALLAGSSRRGTLERFGGWAASCFACRPALWLGERSYSLYVLHMPILLVVVAFAVAPLAARLSAMQAFALGAALTLPLSIAAAALCYAWVERPPIRWARRAVARTIEPARLRTPAVAP